MSNEKYWIQHEQTKELLKIKAMFINGPVQVTETPYFSELLKIVDGIEKAYIYSCPYDLTEDIYIDEKEKLETRFKEDVKRFGI